MLGESTSTAPCPSPFNFILIQVFSEWLVLNMWSFGFLSLRRSWDYEHVPPTGPGSHSHLKDEETDSERPYDLTTFRQGPRSLLAFLPTAALHSFLHNLRKPGRVTWARCVQGSQEPLFLLREHRILTSPDGARSLSSMWGFLTAKKILFHPINFHFLKSVASCRHL